MEKEMGRENRIRLGISSCLLGKEVRYNGGHARDMFVLETFAPYVDFIDVCPEVECGMPVPREAIRLVGDSDRPRLLGHKSQTDFSPQMQTWTATRLAELAREELCGYIFKSKSPSCARYRLKVYPENGGQPSPSGVGMFTREFIREFPLLPVEEEGRLHDPQLREHFIERIFILRRWRELRRQSPARGPLVDFHTRHKMIFLSHSQVGYRRLGKVVGNLGSLSPASAYTEYEQEMTRVLEYKSSPAKHVNVLMHMLGYFKKDLSPAEKQEMLNLIDQFKRQLIPLIVPITLFKHYIGKYEQPYLAEQLYLNPHPLELKLRNHC